MMLCWGRKSIFRTSSILVLTAAMNFHFKVEALADVTNLCIEVSHMKFSLISMSKPRWNSPAYNKKRGVVLFEWICIPIKSEKFKYSKN